MVHCSPPKEYAWTAVQICLVWIAPKQIGESHGPTTAIYKKQLWWLYTHQAGRILRVRVPLSVLMNMWLTVKNITQVQHASLCCSNISPTMMAHLQGIMQENSYMYEFVLCLKGEGGPSRHWCVCNPGRKVSVLEARQQPAMMSKPAVAEWLPRWDAAMWHLPTQILTGAGRLERAWDEGVSCWDRIRTNDPGETRLGSYAKRHLEKILSEIFRHSVSILFLDSQQLITTLVGCALDAIVLWCKWRCVSGFIMVHVLCTQVTN